MMKKTTLSLAIGLATLVGTGVASARSEADAGAVDLGNGILFTPVLDMGLVYDDNVVHTDTNPTDSWVTELRPSFLLSAENDFSEYGLRYTVSHGDYQDSSEDNYTDHMLQANADWELNARHRLGLAASYEDLHEMRGTGYSQGFGALLDEPDRYSESDVSGVYRYGAETARGNIELEAGTRARDYDPTQFIDGVEQNNPLADVRDYGTDYGAARFFYNTGGKTRLLVEAKGSLVGYDNAVAGIPSRDSTQSSVLFGLSWEGTAKTTGTLKVGARSKQFDDAAREDFSAPAWEAGVIWQPLTYSTFEFSTARRFEEARGDGDFADVEVLSASWNHTWLERLSTDVMFYHQNMDYEGTERTEDRLGGTFNLNYEMRRWLILTAGYATGSQDSTLQGYDYDRAVMTFGARVTL
ncbi:hypothetical protein AUP74_01775 [Microbulbifer aggregans]|uniref:Beta-barrel porin 2 n=1 Tax=Microbulbifer aggregans TaxID=1769779 RepID=A0A1C9W7T7_9GAMM|nr:outer membrane beta-barrel protein [Microbulbifer aggregans]AOS97206.1 hypothetical protein AUP74_01775 [Microbulbifer aggregans]